MTTPNTPSVRTMTCIVVSCGTCGNQQHGDDFTPHYESLVQAKEVMDGWAWPDPQTAVCPDCRVRAACAQDGHQWSEWRPCLCDGRIPGHELTPQDLRNCERSIGEDERGFCLANERRPVR